MKEIQLRPYQDGSIQGVKELWLTEEEPGIMIRRVILCAPTGAGKTVMFSAMAQQLLTKSLTKKVLILTNRQELLTQAGGTLDNFGVRFEPITAKSKSINTRARCYVAMVETFCNRIVQSPWLLDIDLVIIDECHYGNFKKLFALFKPGTFVIGATATPIARDKKDPLTNYYQGLVNRVQIAELVEAGFLAKCITFAPKIDTSGLRLQGGEYSERSQVETFAKRSVYDGLLTRYLQACEKYNDGKPMKTVCFNVNVEHSLAVTAMFNEAGITARHVDGKTHSAQRAKIIGAYKAGEFTVICNVGILNAGFDDPETTCIIFNRATTSVSLWLQSLGRGSRKAPGKNQFVVLDMGNNWPTLQLWDSVRDWNQLWLGKKIIDREGVAPAKECQNEECGAIVPLSTPVCPECGFVFPIKEKRLAVADEFVEITADMVTALPDLSPEDLTIKAMRYGELKTLLPEMSVADLLHIEAVKPFKSGWALNVIKARDLDEYDYRDQIEELATLKGYKRGWVNRLMEEYFTASKMAEV